MNKNYLYIILFITLLVTASSANQPHSPNELQPQKKLQPSMGASVYTSQTLKVMTLNLAHGRKDGFNQIFLSKSKIHQNLEDIIEFLKPLDIDVVALQEADSPSWWSGNFNHVALLADGAAYSAYMQTNHVQSWFFSYGTAMLSRLAFTDTVKYTFQPSPPTLNKGFTLGQIAWQPDEKIAPILIDIVSVHLDFSRKTVRETQIAEIKKVLADRINPAIVLGDFNSDWFSKEKVIHALIEKGDYHVYEPEAEDLGTYKSKHRLDWIVISKELDFKSLTVYPDVLSDHSAVMAEIIFSAEFLAEQLP